ncbi:MAG: hypothetical protein EPO26_14760 [Chloroflexota bacterium]|nr:MAG: hypothetical protein EPO26_14760 [Chloroflexota bacterium]
MRTEIRLAGFGGQGIILAGHLIGKAAALYDGRFASMSQSYGPEARGGACAAEVVISDDPIDYPLVEKPDILVLMSREAANKYGEDASASRFILIDDGLVHLDAGVTAHGIPATRLAEKLGNKIAANVVMVGFLIAVTGAISRDAAEQALRSTVRARTLDLNLRALAAGCGAFDRIAEAVR